MSGLTVHTGDTLTTAARWISWDVSERRRRAIEACRDRDHATLWELTRVFLTLHGKAGARVSPRTLEAYEGGVKVLLAGWQGVSLIHASRDDAAMLVRQFEEAGLSTSTIQVRLAGIRALYRALRWAGATDGDPFRDVRPAPDKRNAWDKRIPYSPTEVDAMLAACDVWHDHALVMLCGFAGLRVSEAVALEWKDIDLDALRLTVVNGKGGKLRHVPMAGRLVFLLNMYPHDCRTGRLMHYGTTHQARNRIKRICEKAGTPYRSCHSLRHHCGTKVVQTGGTLLDAARMLGHSNTSTAEIYVKWADDSLKNRIADW